MVVNVQVEFPFRDFSIRSYTYVWKSWIDTSSRDRLYRFIVLAVIRIEFNFDEHSPILPAFGGAISWFDVPADARWRSFGTESIQPEWFKRQLTVALWGFCEGNAKAIPQTCDRKYCKWMFCWRDLFRFVDGGNIVFLHGLRLDSQGCLEIAFNVFRRCR